jgi:hypothetical protein
MPSKEWSEEVSQACLSPKVHALHHAVCVMAAERKSSSVSCWATFELLHQAAAVVSNPSYTLKSAGKLEKVLCLGSATVDSSCDW